MLKIVQNQGSSATTTENTNSSNNGKKPKSNRNNEKRRERSKVAARCRRGRESEIFADLSSCLPLPENVRSGLDKASIARLAVTHLKLKGMMNDVFPMDPNGVPDLQFDSFINNAMGGFVIVLSADGDIVYVSESITTHLGLPQCEVMGQSVYNFSHPCDHADMKELFTLNKNEAEGSNKSYNRSCFFRMKCTITPKGRSVHLRAASYKAINCTGHLFVGKEEGSKWFVGIGESLPDPTNVTFPLNKQAFVTKHAPDMKCEEVAGSIEEFLGYKPDDLVGKSFFEFHHAADGQEIGKDFKQLYTKGQIQTQRYRFLAKYGGWVWIVSQATLLKSESNSKPSGIVCLHFVTSGIENANEMLSQVQVQRPKGLLPALVQPVKSEQPEIIDLEKDSILPIIGLSSPIPSTTKIFAPRTEDMDTGFLMPCDNTLIVSKEEPEDLTHLAPIAGDECVELHVPLLDDLLKSFDEASIDYTRNGYYIDVDSDELPLFNIEEYSKLSQQANGDDFNEKPLFLRNSDPTLYPVADPRLLSPFQPQSSPTLSNGDRSVYLSESPMNFYDPCLGDNTPQEKLNSPDTAAIYDPGPKNREMDDLPQEDLSEFTAPYIPMDESDDFPLLSTAGEIIWPLEFQIVPELKQIEKSHANIIAAEYSKLVIPPDKVGERDNFILQIPNRPMLNDANIDKVSVDVDIASIFKARKPGDVPKVVTKYVFGNYEPPSKLRKMGSPPPNRKVVLLPGSTITTNQRTDDIQVNNLLFNPSSLMAKMGRNDEQQTPQQQVSSIRKRNLFGMLLGQSGTSMPSLLELTQQDCEVNAPLSENCLLQGSDLIRALEQDTHVPAM